MTTIHPTEIENIPVDKFRSWDFSFFTFSE
jgi:hypothetical protein